MEIWQIRSLWGAGGRFRKKCGPEFAGKGFLYKRPAFTVWKNYKGWEGLWRLEPHCYGSYGISNVRKHRGHVHRQTKIYTKKYTVTKKLGTAACPFPRPQPQLTPFGVNMNEALGWALWICLQVCFNCHAGAVKMLLVYLDCAVNVISFSIEKGSWK